jgi:hypothetical protein
LNAPASPPLFLAPLFVKLPDGNVTNKLCKLDRVTRALLAGFGHDDIIAWLATEGIVPSTASDFKLTHYPLLLGLDRKYPRSYSFLGL